MRSIEIERHVKNLKLTERQRAIVTGLLLGDGHLETQNNGTEARPGDISETIRHYRQNLFAI